MSKLNIVWHIGYPKCASTSLQQSLFYPSENLNFFSSHVPPSRVKDTSSYSHKKMFDRLLGDEHFDCSQAMSLWNDIVLPSLDDTKCNVISEEKILLHPSSTKRKLEFIKAVSPEAKVIIFYRPPDVLLRSMYDMLPFNFFEDRRREHLSDLEWMSKCLDRPDAFMWNNLHYDRIFPQIESMFAECLILPLREISSSYDALAALLGISIDEFEVFLKEPNLNPANHHIRRLSRSVFKTKSPADFLPRKPIKYLNRLLAAKLPDSKTTLSPNAKELILSEFSEAYEYISQREAKLSADSLGHAP